MPADLESICRRCLEKRPEDRYPSAQAVAEDLDRFLAGVPVDGQTRSVMDDLRRAWGRIVPTRGIGIWYMLFVGAASTTLSIAAVQVAVLLDAPVWAGWAALACYFVGWFAITWVITVRHRHTLGTVERNSHVIQIGMKLTALATLPAPGLAVRRVGGPGVRAPVRHHRAGPVHRRRHVLGPALPHRPARDPHRRPAAARAAEAVAGPVLPDPTRRSGVGRLAGLAHRPRGLRRTAD